MTVQNAKKAAEYEQVIFDDYFYNFSELLAKATEIDQRFELCINTENDFQTVLLCIDILRDFEASRSIVSTLPLNAASCENLDRYIANVERNIYTILNKVLNDQKMTENERHEIGNSSLTSKRLLSELNDVLVEIKKNQSLGNVDAFEMYLKKRILLDELN